MSHQPFKIRAKTAVQNCLGESVVSINRFSTGLSHFVFDIITQSGTKYVVRITKPERNSELKKGIFWQKQLEPFDLPLPKIYETGKIERCAFAIYERLLGDDLETIYPELSNSEKVSIAHTVADIQKKSRHSKCLKKNPIRKVHWVKN